MKGFYFIHLLFLLITTNTLASDIDEQLIVKYLQNNQIHTVQGEKTKDGYRFNASSNKIVSIATLEWPPYIGERLCNKGWGFQFAIALLASKGYQVNIAFYPWARSVKLVEQGKVDILFPEYFIEKSAPSDIIPNKNRHELLILSNELPGGEISLLKRKGYEFHLQKNLSNLEGKFIGVVRGYQNTPKFDAMMDAKLFDVIKAVDEFQLIKLLIAKRVDFIIGDPKAFHHSIKHSTLTDDSKQTLLNQIEEVEPTLQYKHLYFAVNAQLKERQTLLNDINHALISFEQSGETNRFINLTSDCVAHPKN